MRQVIDLNRKKEYRGKELTVMFHGSVWHFFYSNLVSSCYAQKPKSACRAAVSAAHASTVATMQQLLSRAKSFASDLSGQLGTTLRGPNNTVSQARKSPLEAFQVEGVLNSSCDCAALHLTNQKAGKHRFVAA
jgi:hypothetical protein